MRIITKTLAVVHALMGIGFLYLLNQYLIEGSVWGILFTTPLMVGCILSVEKLSR